MKKALFATSTNPEIAQNLYRGSFFREGKAKISKFADQEISILIEEDVEDKDLYVLGSSFPPAENLLELLILIHTLKANGARSVKALIPYWGYAKADHIIPPGATLSAELMARCLEATGVKEISIINIHSSVAARFFSVPMNSLSAVEKLVVQVKSWNLENVCVISPDKGGVIDAQYFARRFGTNDIVYLLKRRPKFDETQVIDISGSVKGKNCVIMDDMIQSGGTVISTAETLVKNGAKGVYVAVVHLVNTAGCTDRLDKDENVTKVLFTNTVPYNERLSDKFEVIDVSELFQR